MNASKTTAILQSRFDQLFSNVPTLEGFDAQVWSEGGEWPILRTIKHSSPVRKPRMQWPDSPTVGRDLAHMVRTIKESFESTSVLAVSMHCGAGKSTRLMASLLDSMSCSTILCIQSSSVAADELHNFMTAQCPNLIVSRVYTEHVKSLVYLSAGEFLKLLHESLNLPDTLFVIDEYHSVNPVYKAMLAVLNCTSNNVLCMSASDARNLQNRDGVKIHAYASFDDKAKDNIKSLLKSPNPFTLCVGCCPGYSIYNAANHYVGVTMVVRSVIDFGTRLDPTIQDNKLLKTYRVASVVELTQSLGRLARIVGTDGAFHYFKNPSSFAIVGQPKLYSRIYGALISAFGLGIESNVKSMIATLQCSHELVVASSRTVTSASSVSGSKEPSLIRSRSDSVSIASHTSLVRPAKDNETMRVTKVSSGYMVDYVPNDPVKRALSFRAKTWTSKPPTQTFPSAVVRQDTLLDRLNSSEYVSVDSRECTPLLPEHIVHASDMQIVNDILSGRTIPTYSADEFNLVKRAWAVYLRLNHSRSSQSSVQIERSISDYYEAYNRMACVFSNSSKYK